MIKLNHRFWGLIAIILIIFLSIAFIYRSNTFDFQKQRYYFQKFVNYLYFYNVKIKTSKELQPLTIIYKKEQKKSLQFLIEIKNFNQKQFEKLINLFEKEHQLISYIDFSTPNDFYELWLKSDENLIYIKIQPLKKIFKKKKSTKPKGKLLIIIDDFGHDLFKTKKFLQLGNKINYAILPRLKFSSQSAILVHKAQADVILHQPMQPVTWPQVHPGPGALMLNHNIQDMRQTIFQNLKSVPFVIAVNNHMGSAFTADSKCIDNLMKVFKEKKIIFIDSKTASGQLTRKIAKKYQVPFLARNIFLDNQIDKPHIQHQLYNAVKIAKINYHKNNNIIVVIGHPYSNTYSVLKKEIPHLIEQGISFLKISNIF